MGCSAPGDPFVKGAACQCLDMLPAQPDKMAALQGALLGVASSKFVGLESVLGQFLFPLKFDPKRIGQLVRHLKECWFDPTSTTCFFPGAAAAETYGKGLLRTLSLSMRTTPPLPIDSYWVLDHAEFDMLNFATARQVTLLIATPRPRGAAVKGPLVGMDATEAWSTRALSGNAEERKIPVPNL